MCGRLHSVFPPLVMSSSYDSKLFRHYSRLLPLGLNTSESIVYCLRGPNSNLIILATASCKLTAYYLNVDSFELLDEIAQYKSWVQKCILTNDNTYLAVLAEQVVFVYNAKQRYAFITSFLPHDSTINSILWTARVRPVEEMYLITAGKDATIRFWNGKNILNKKFHRTKGAPAPAPSPDRSLGVFQNPKDFHHEPFEAPGHKEAVMAIACDPQDKYVVSGGVDYRILLWGIETGDYLGEYDGGSPSLPLPPLPIYPPSLPIPSLIHCDCRAHGSHHGSLLGCFSPGQVCFSWFR